ncbi:hypothetical protein [Paenibacillus crassostreae]|uniref:hypothetical protein n=1 Tax=Paenibacillus crassostreae TaxID=1763538 RepID=UPI0012FFB027|nr:hypothetical protein [Paenibacillus crassostreae]
MSTISALDRPIRRGSASFSRRSCLLFPGYDKAFHKVCNPTSLELLSRYPSPKELLDADHVEIITVLLSNRKGRAWNDSKLQQLLTIANNSLPDLHAIQAQKINN